jgi:hypothetical protein
VPGFFVFEEIQSSEVGLDRAGMEVAAILAALNIVRQAYESITE